MRWLNSRLVRFLGLALFTAIGLRHLPAADSGSIVMVEAPRPLAKMAAVLTERYGVPVSYEDVSRYSYYAELEDPVNFHAREPRSKVLPPRPSRLSILTPPVSERTPATSSTITALLNSALEKHESSGNPGRFRLLQTGTALVITPVAARNASGQFVPDASPLELRISIPEADGTSLAALTAFSHALSAAAGKRVDFFDGFITTEFRFGADNEIARDVLSRLIQTASKHMVGIHSTDSHETAHAKIAWDLILNPGLEAPHDGAYELSFRVARLASHMSVFECPTPALDCALR